MSANQRYMALGQIRLGEHVMGSVDDHPDAKRMRRLPSLAPVVIGGVAPEEIQKFCLNLEPFLRKTVQDELERSLSKHGHLLYTPPSLLVNDVDASVSLKLAFTKPLLLPIFTNKKLLDMENNPLEVLVLDGDFRHEDSSEEEWTSVEFSDAIVREREGRRPLLVGTLNVAMADHGLAVIDDVLFTDNSSWIRSRRFRLGVRPAPGSYDGPRIREAVSQSFMVKDHRGELYKKHFPPNLGDEVWRLKNIRKEGPIHKRLEAEDVRTVQDLMKLYTINPEDIKKLVGMSDRLWKATIQHAKTCAMGGKCYIFRPQECDTTLILSPVCEILAVRIGDKLCSLQELHPHQVVQMKQLATQAYQQWDQLEEAETSSTEVAERSMPDCSSVTQLRERQNESISSGSGPDEGSRSYLDTTGATVALGTSSAAPTVARADAACWSPCVESDDNLIIWNSMQFSVNQLD